MLVLTGLLGCKEEGISLESNSPLTPEQIAHLLRCEPERSHHTWSAVSNRYDSECDMKIDAVQYLQAARRLGRLPGSEDRDAIGVFLRAEGLVIQDISTSVKFTDFEVVSPLRGPHVLRARLSSGRDVVFCCGKVKACTSLKTCTCRSDCDNE